MALFKILKVTRPGSIASSNDNPFYYFKGIPGLYTGAIATATGITEATGLSARDVPIIPVGELTRTGWVETAYMEIEIQAATDTTPRQTTFREIKYLATIQIATLKTALGADGVKIPDTYPNLLLRNCKIVDVVKRRKQVSK